MKRWFSLISFALILTLVLAGCGGKSANETSGSGGKEVVAWAWNINVPVLKKAAAEYQKENPGFKLKVVDMGREDVYSKLTTGLQAGGKGLPDIVLVEDDRFQGYLDAFPNAFLNLSKKGFDKQEDKFPEFKKTLLSKDGDMYGFPFDAGPTGVFYRTDYFEKAGVDPNSIKTWDDYIAAGKKIKEKVGVDLLGLDFNNDDGLFRMTLTQQGTFYFNNKGKLNLTSKEAKKAMELNKKLKEAGIVKNTVGWDASISALAEGKVASSPSGAWLSGSITQQAPDLKGKWGVFLLPSFEEGGNRASNLGGSNYVISATSQKADEAYKFMEYFSTTDKVQEEAMKGGLFPSLNTVYSSKLFTAQDEYFNNQTIWKTFADEMKDIKPVNFTGNYSVANSEAVKAVSEVTNGKGVKDSLEAAQKRLENRIQK
ncbi:ABC transporter substrate-binding protein [Priestia megaterium]|uniref:ABC transporter substrate-binding protein n=1 Tax=Priestia megaterium TaxID=1404 RepID=UPI000BF5B69D|nr:sugar ABC transporter substrate-binding protein [Priestia megaterium]PFJ98019.1 sugar ABC transporter substrate-binding protein [Priestia megaterium]PMD11577.1 sugar ABC transporter substrate-binding protein [Priestia megaterium]PNE05975.1 sugar ABC transporter substrate-binding protein [Priestia megaterium]WJD81818.1 sugar ABC transporter substrate-binding protein [Priestia megaterium]